MQRILALLVLLIPGIIAGIGIKFMRDMFFGVLHAPIPSLILQFIIGLVLFLAGLSFIGGFILYRDRKRNKVQEKFQKEGPPNGEHNNN
ncbi:DUF2627 domain-containing protein [Ferdinandcohnia sp. Marseille-Q9671]